MGAQSPPARSTGLRCAQRARGRPLGPRLGEAHFSAVATHPQQDRQTGVWGDTRTHASGRQPEPTPQATKSRRTDRPDERLVIRYFGWSPQ